MKKENTLLRVIIGLIPLVLIFIFVLGYYPILLSLANNNFQRLGACSLMISITLFYGWLAIRLGPQGNKSKVRRQEIK
jgi:membrane protease YdiL (CAAX protease family)